LLANINSFDHSDLTQQLTGDRLAGSDPAYGEINIAIKIVFGLAIGKRRFDIPFIA
jgi:hypothetical protein